jgi:hypothetical protein
MPSRLLHMPRAILLVLVFGLAFGTVVSTPAVWTASLNARTDAPIEEDDECLKSEADPAAMAERRIDRPARTSIGVIPRPRSTSRSSPVAAAANVRPTLALNNGLSAHYRC